MIVSVLQVAACLVLIYVSVAKHWSKSNHESAYRALIPYTIAAGIPGAILVLPPAVEVFVARYSGSIYEIEAADYRLNGPYWWVYLTGFILQIGRAHV